jgi:hypothetical protein
VSKGMVLLDQLRNSNLATFLGTVLIAAVDCNSKDYVDEESSGQRLLAATGIIGSSTSERIG